MCETQSLHDSLGKEAVFLHRQFFGKEIPDDLRQKFIDAHLYCDLTRRPMQGAMKKIILHQLDAEAIEYSTRKLDTALTRKIHILFYLAENHPDYYPFFINEKDDRARACLTLVRSGFFSVYKWIKGRYLTWRHHLV